jgi:hypothetical protein
METKKTYLYIVYKNYKRYRNFNKFYEIELTVDQLAIKEKYIDKDEYKFEFFAVLPEFAQTVLKYLYEKFVKSNFPLKIESGELQAACIEFINKCNQHVQEKSKHATNHALALTQQQCQVLLPFQEVSTMQIQVILLGNKVNGEVTVFCSTASLSALVEQLSQFGSFQVLDITVINASEVDCIMQSFQSMFSHLKTLSTNLQLLWYKIS